MSNSAAKKRRLDGEAKAAEEENGKQITMQIIRQTFAEVTKDPNNHHALLNLATLQHTLLRQVANQEHELSRLRGSQSKKEKERQAVIYERRFLERQIEHHRQHPIPNLRQLAHEETGVEDDPTVSNETILETFLQVNPMDPKNKDNVTTILQTCFQQRNVLGKTVQAKKLALQAAEKELKIHEDFLKQLPIHLQTIDRSTQGLSKFMQKNNMIHPLAGTKDRLQRLDKAKELPTPLRTLFTMIQQCVDNASIEDCKIGISSNLKVSLQLPVPEIIPSALNKKDRLVSILFSYNEASSSIEVTSSGGTTAMHHESFLQELFPNDDHFAWAQHLAGLHPAQDTPVTLLSTRTILQQLQRRVQSNAILRHTLYSLQRCHVPATTSTTDDEKKPHSQLILFRHNAKNNTYDVAVRHPNGKELSEVSVALTPRHRYPGIPPVWKFSSTTCYAALEDALNVELLSAATDAPDWILVQQVHQLLLRWDSIVESSAGPRTVRGRDRQAIVS